MREWGWRFLWLAFVVSPPCVSLAGEQWLGGWLVGSWQDPDVTKERIQPSRLLWDFPGRSKCVWWSYYPHSFSFSSPFVRRFLLSSPDFSSFIFFLFLIFTLFPLLSFFFSLYLLFSFLLRLHSPYFIYLFHFLFSLLLNFLYLFFSVTFLFFFQFTSFPFSFFISSPLLSFASSPLFSFTFSPPPSSSSFTLLLFL